jgi:hypothetical protein
MMTVANLHLTRWVPAGTNKWLRDNLASARLRLLLGALAFIAVAAGLTLVDEADSGIVQRLKQKQLRLAGFEQLGQGDLWHRRRAETDLARVQAEGRLWEAETDGIAQANFQTWITDEARRAGIGPIDIRISINAPANNPLKLRQLSAQIHGRFDAAALFKFAHAIAAQDHLLVVDHLEVQTVPAPYFEMLLETFLRPAGNA